MKKYYIALALALALFAFTAKSATTYTVYNIPTMRLSVGISDLKTVGIKLSAPIRNGERVSYPALTGGILHIKNARFEEHIYYASGSVASSTLEVTLYGVVRGYCWNSNTFASCEAGRTWAKGTETTLVNDMRLFNFSMKKDLANTTSGSGAILCGSTANPCMFQGRYTTAQRDAFTWKGGAGEGTPIIHNTTTDTLQWWDGSTWTEIGDTGVANASETVAGKVELGTLADQSGATLLGATGAPTVIQTQYLTGTGGRAWRIPYTAKVGIITGSLLGTGNQYANGGNTHLSGTGGWVATQTIDTSLLMPTGAIIAYGSTTPPSGWVLADGRPHTRTGTGAALFAVLGTTFGVGNGSSTFNVPDLRGRVAVSPDGGQGRISASNTIGAAAGTNDGSHAHAQSLSNTDSNSGGIGVDRNANTSATSVLPPYLVIQYIIKN